MPEYNLKTDDGLLAACAALDRPAKWAMDSPRWVTLIAGTIRGVRSAGVEQRATRDFQQKLWESNHIAAIGQGRISVARALDDARFRTWLAERSMTKLPPPADQLPFISSFYDELQQRLAPYLPGRMPHLKIFRVMAALYPEVMTTIADRRALEELSRAMGGHLRSPVERQLWVRRRIDALLGESPVEAEALAERMCVPWAMYENLLRRPTGGT